MRISAVFVALAALSLVACGGPGPAEGCTESSDCPEGSACVDGMCAVRGDGGGGPDAFVPPIDAGPPRDAGASDAGSLCADVSCGPGERCEVVAGAASCLANTCEDLTCAATERCAPAPVGAGNLCVDASCADSLDCPASEHCDGAVCRTDVCVPGRAVCDGMDVSSCEDDGGGEAVRFTCGGDAYFESVCSSDGRGAFCPCEDDWDCPAFSRCEAGRCEGTGVSPTCMLPPQPFTSVLPSPEIRWGGLSQAERDAVGSPFPSSSQVSATPLVVNLDDDTGDGRIDELDTPEIVFLTYCGTSISANGALRAIHGGGPRKGEDYFATLGTTVWHEGEPIPTVDCGEGDINSTAGLAAGDLDGDGVPEIVVITETSGVRIYANDGTPIAATANNIWSGYNDPTPSIANLDQQGLAEIIVGNRVITLRRDAGSPITVEDVFVGSLMSGRQGQGPISCVANIAGGDELEVVGGTTAYRLPTPPPGVTRRSECAPGDTSSFCQGALEVVWDGQAVNGAALIPNAQRDGFCAIADVLGADEDADPGPANPLDGVPEVVLINEGHLIILNGETGERRRFVNLGAGTDGGAPNIDDFDGDGFPEVGTAFGLRYIAIDLQPPTALCPAWPNAFVDGTAGLQGNEMRSPPAVACATDAACGDPQFACNATIGQCVCLHNGWTRVTEDNSSRVTGSTVFDFNGDGAAEIVYNDECYFRIYEGLTGAVLFREGNSSRTRVENPVVADVDNDGNAEIVFAANNDSNACSAGQTNNGIEVWGDSSDSWVSARRIWNQHAYHVTNVLEGGGVPTREPENWGTYGGRTYNTYRSQPRSFGLAPDLVVDRVQASSPDAACGTLGTSLDIVVRVVNRGDLRVGPDVMVGFYGEWTSPALSEPLYSDGAMTPLRAPLGTTLEPGGSTLVTARYEAANNSPAVLPSMIRVVVDDAMAERECIEDNNTLSIVVDGGATAADLAVTLGETGGVCPAQTFETTVANVGSASASDIVVRYYVGDPSSGGAAFHDELVAGPIAPGESVTFTANIPMFPRGPMSVVHVVVDPDDAIPECSDGNNADRTAERVGCPILI